MIGSRTSLLVAALLTLTPFAASQRGHGGGGEGGGHSSGGSSGGHSSGGYGGGHSSGGYGGSHSSSGDRGRSESYSGGRSSGGYEGRSGGYSGGRSYGGYEGRSSGSSRSSGEGHSSFGGGSYGGHRSPFERSIGGGRESIGGVRTGYGERGDGYGHGGSEHYGGGYNHSVLGVQIDRNRAYAGHGDYRRGGFYGGLRYGYSGFGFGFDFGFPYYAYDPFAFGVVASPWYPYSYLPPYIAQDHVVVVDHYNPLYDGGADWREEDRRTDVRQDEDRPANDRRLDDALENVRDGFERNSRREAERLVPEDGQVAVFNQGKYDYSLAPDEFRKMFLDGVEASKTSRYEIVERSVRGDAVHVRARHEFTDSSGADQTVYHTYTLRLEGGRYVIREFGSE